MLLLPQGVHALPEALVLEATSWPAAASRSSGLALAVARSPGEPLQHRAVEHEEPAVDPPVVQLGLLLEALDEVAVDGHLTEAGGWSHRRDRGQRPVGSVEGHELAAIQIADTVTVGEMERVAVQIRVDSGDALRPLGLDWPVSTQRQPPGVERPASWHSGLDDRSA